MGDIEKKNQSEGIIPIASQKEIRKSIEENLEPPDGGCQVKKLINIIIVPKDYLFLTIKNVR